MVTECPNCKANLQGDEIPEKDRENYGGQTHFSRVIGIVANDRIAAWQCPDCGHKWPRTAELPGGFRTFNLISY